MNDESWKQLALRIYPRIDQLVKAHRLDNPCYQLLFRDQLLATSTTTAAAVPPPSGNERLAKFVFTIELSWTGDDAEANSLTWVGRLRETEPRSDDGVSCQLFEAESPPKWACDLRMAIANWNDAINTELNEEEAELAFIAVATAIKTRLRTRMLVSELTPYGMRTLLLCEDERCQGEVWEGDGLFRLFDCKELALTSFDIVTRAEGGQEPERPKLQPWLSIDTGRLDGIFTYPFDPAGVVDDMRAEAVAEYLEHFAPWRTQSPIPRRHRPF